MGRKDEEIYIYLKLMIEMLLPNLCFNFGITKAINLQRLGKWAKISK